MLNDAFTNISEFAMHYEFAIRIFAWMLFGVGILQNIIYSLQLPAAWLEMRQHSQAHDTESAWQLLISDAAVPISVIVPAYNEEATIVENVKSMLSLKYPDMELIIVNDGSKDDTLKCLIDAFSLEQVHRAYDLAVPAAPIRGLYGTPAFPQMLVVDKENGLGKANATNAGINLSRNDLFCVIDADSILEREALLRSVRPFMENPKEMVAVGGTIRVINGCEIKDGHITNVGLPNRFLPLVQSMEYIRAFLMSRLAWSYWGSLLIISGAFGIFRRDRTIEVGGFSLDTVGEDYDLVVKLHRHLSDTNTPYEMRYVPEPVCWTEAPESFAILGNQRKRWQRGSLEVFLKNKGMLFNPKYGRIGMLGLPNSLLIDVVGPIVEMLGLILLPIFWALGVLQLEFMLAYTALFFVYGVFMSISSLVLEEMELERTPFATDLLKLALIAILENFGYRQLNNFWRISGFLDFLRKKNDWGVMVRKGFRSGGS